jgi:hypothetical protein
MDTKTTSLVHGTTDLGTATRIALVSSIAALFLAGWSFLLTLDDETDVRQLEQRLACLELPGANDCGLDGR